MLCRALVILLVVGCKTATPQPTIVPTTPVLDCTTVELDACASTAGCSTIRGTSVGSLDAGPLCLDPAATEQVIGCQSDENACPAVEIYASDDQDEVYWIPAGCAPAGWTVQNITVEACTQDCAALSVEECQGLDECMVIRGQRFAEGPDVGGECHDERAVREPLACAPASACDTAITYATEGLDTAIYAFPNGCIPDGWTAVSGPFHACECASIALADCAADAACQVLSARPMGMDASGVCVDPTAVLEPLICGPTSDCADLLSYAIQPSTGDTFEFPDTCTPSSWESVPNTFGLCQP